LSFKVSISTAWLLIVLGAPACGGRGSLVVDRSPGDASLDASAPDTADATSTTADVLPELPMLPPMIGGVVCPSGAMLFFDSTSCWTPVDSGDHPVTFCHPLIPGSGFLRVYVQGPELVTTNNRLAVGEGTDAVIVVEVWDQTIDGHALFKAISGSALLDHYDPNPLAPHFGGMLFDIQMAPQPATGQICRMPTTSFYSR
jgi:hypothetical protein